MNRVRVRVIVSVMVRVRVRLGSNVISLLNSHSSTGSKKRRWLSELIPGPEFEKCNDLDLR